MQLTKTQQENIRDMLRDRPLEGGETRKIPEMGELYISSYTETLADDESCLLVIDVDNNKYIISSFLLNAENGG